MLAGMLFPLQFFPCLVTATNINQVNECCNSLGIETIGFYCLYSQQLSVSAFIFDKHNVYCNVCVKTAIAKQRTKLALENQSKFKGTNEIGRTCRCKARLGTPYCSNTQQAQHHHLTKWLQARIYSQYRRAQGAFWSEFTKYKITV
jgi:hypothetical protein